jgi:hypothetical protein
MLRQASKQTEAPDEHAAVLRLNFVDKLQVGGASHSFHPVNQTQ